MNEKKSSLNEDTKKFLDGIKFIETNDIEKLNFYEACLYLEKLNVLDNATKVGDHDE